MSEEPTAVKTTKTDLPKGKVLVRSQHKNIEAIVGEKIITFRNGQAMVDEADAEELIKREWFYL